MEEYSKSIEISKSEKAVPEKVEAWWKEISNLSDTKATPGKLYAVGNYLVELIKNSLNDGKSDGKVTATFDDEKITIVVENFASEDSQTNLNVDGDYGLKEIIEYADVLEVEANGRLYGKDNRNHLEEIDDSDLRVGNRITFVKYIIAPPVEEAEETFRGRDFGQRM